MSATQPAAAGAGAIHPVVPDAMVPIDRGPGELAVVRRGRSAGRAPYTREDDLALVKWAEKHPTYPVQGRIIWEMAERAQISRHSWQSMQNRWRRIIQKRLATGSFSSEPVAVSVGTSTALGDDRSASHGEGRCTSHADGRSTSHADGRSTSHGDGRSTIEQPAPKATARTKKPAPEARVAVGCSTKVEQISKKAASRVDVPAKRKKLVIETSVAAESRQEVPTASDHRPTGKWECLDLASAPPWLLEDQNFDLVVDVEDI